MKSYNEFMDPSNVQDIRDELTKIMFEDAETFHSLGKKMGINHQTISKFIQEKGDLNFSSLVKVQEYLLSRKSK